jgi:hypothetical protein
LTDSFWRGIERNQLLSFVQGNPRLEPRHPGISYVKSLTRM